MANTQPRIPVALPHEVYEAIKAIAMEEERSMSWILAKATKTWLKDNGNEYQHLIMVQTALEFENGEVE